MSRSVNSVTIIGNLTRDPEMRYTPAGHAVTSFGVATNRVWTTAEGTRKEDTEFHEVVAWNKLAEICNQYLRKGRKVYVRGRLQTRRWEAKDGSPRSRTEIVAEDMVILDSRRETEPTTSTAAAPATGPIAGSGSGSGAVGATTPTEAAKGAAVGTESPAAADGETRVGTAVAKEEVAEKSAESAEPDQETAETASQASGATASETAETTEAAEEAAKPASEDVDPKEMPF